MSESAPPLPTPDVRRARVVAEHRGAFRVAADGAEGWASLSGQQYHRAADRRDHPVVGDWVVVARWQDMVEGRGNAQLQSIEPRRSLLVRRAAGEPTVPQPIAANVDVALIVTSANLDVSVSRIDRYLDLVQSSDIAALIVLNKSDLPHSDQVRSTIAARFPAHRVVATSAVTGEGTQSLRSELTQRTAVLLGSSGVGKSSLLNRLLERDAQEVRTIRDGDDRGQHTTTSRRLLELPDGGAIIDTPGMREVGLWNDDAADAAARDAFTAVANRCRYSDCRHQQEPGCAVRAAMVSGELTPDALTSHLKRRDERTRTAATATAGARHRQRLSSGNARRKRNGGSSE